MPPFNPSPPRQARQKREEFEAFTFAPPPYFAIFSKYAMRSAGKGKESKAAIAGNACKP
jgi:hypothetical protein